jgi:hypothetical protein
MLHPAIKKQAFPTTMLRTGLFSLGSVILRAMVDSLP